ncbi:MAG: nucleoside kinase [Spirochaetales bacterium]|nr:nucleoside kinase [Spirochaetales bacterium]
MNQIKVTSNGKTASYPYGTRVNEILKESDGKYPVVAVLVNNELTSLSYKIETNAEVKPIYPDDPRGARVYRRSLSFLLAMASSEIFSSRLIISHSIGNGYYYYLEDNSEITDKDIEILENKMNSLVQKALPIYRRKISYTDAVNYFKEHGRDNRVLLMEFRNESKIPIYQCDSFWDMSFDPLVPNTSLLSHFELKKYETGLLLRYPHTATPMQMAEMKDNPLLYSIYSEYKAWGKILDIDSVGKLNKKIAERDIQPFIRVAESLHNKKISEIADRIHDRKGQVKTVLIAGPSSSGKTTFTKKLGIQLRVLGFNPQIIGLDDYFVPRTRTPRDAEGNYDFECLEAIDVELLNQNLMDLFSGKEVEIPTYDFKTGTRKYTGNMLKMEDRNILLMEGIHGLNANLTPLVKPEQKYQIFISALTQLNIDDSNRIATTDNRLLRRIIRDHQFRGHDALTTLRMWNSVKNGEKKNIFPFQNNADSAFNSALDYELAVLKPYAEPLLKQVKPWDDEYAEAMRMLNFLNNFLPLPVKHVPMDSILREFIGDSGFKY